MTEISCVTFDWPQSNVSQMSVILSHPQSSLCEKIKKWLKMTENDWENFFFDWDLTENDQGDWKMTESLTDLSFCLQKFFAAKFPQKSLRSKGRQIKLPDLFLRSLTFSEHFWSEPRKSKILSFLVPNLSTSQYRFFAIYRGQKKFSGFWSAGRINKNSDSWNVFSNDSKRNFCSPTKTSCITAIGPMIESRRVERFSL